ncbi:hypothetical protein [Halobacteriovorax sp.]|uniref:hypothetical protein n=1 Tax=Halobacteriovorax sp. TaxID=2020862 RepID=UPI003AF2089A
MNKILLNFILIILAFTMVSCDDSLEAEGSLTVTPGAFEITILRPSSDGSSISGYSVISGHCGKPGYPIEVTGAVNLYSICQSDYHWAAPVSALESAVGAVTVNVQLKDKNMSGGSSVASRTFTKQDNICEDSANLTKLYANSESADGSLIPYKICTSQQFLNIALNPNSRFQLATDIDFAGQNIVPIAAVFSGELNGRGYALKNYIINRAADNSVGIFKYISDANISELHIHNAQVTGNSRVGLLAGDWRGAGTINSIRVSGKVNAITMAGGLIGLGNSSSSLNISDSQIQVDVNANNYTGGVIGYINTNDGLLNVSNTDIYSNVAGHDYVGGFAGLILEPNQTFTNVHHKGSITSTGVVVGGLIGESAGGSFDNVSHIGSVGTSKDAVDVNVGGLIGHAKGTHSISNSKVVSNITSGGSYTGGLIGRLLSGSITNSYTRGSIVVNEDYYNSVVKFVGGLVGNINLDSSISGSHSHVDINSTAYYVGGLVGFLGGGNTTIDSSYSVGAIEAMTSNVGGLVGFMSGKSITNSFSHSNITITNPTPKAYIGGIAGYTKKSDVTFDKLYNSGSIHFNNGIADNVGGLFGYVEAQSISNVFNTGNITGARSLIGGIAGYLKTPIHNAYAGGNISGSLRYIGGIAGLAFQNNISDVFVKANLEGDGNIGGITGWYIDDATTITNAYMVGRINKSSDSTLGESIFGPVFGTSSNTNLTNNTFFLDSITFTDMASAAPFNGFNRFGNQLTAEELASELSYTGFNFAGANDWSMPSIGFKLPGETLDYNYAIFDFMNEANYGFNSIQTFSDDPINEGTPNLFGIGSEKTLSAIAANTEQLDIITSTDPVSNVSVGTYSISFTYPDSNGAPIATTKLIHGECGVVGEEISITGSVTLSTICQSNNRWVALIDATELTSGTITINAQLKDDTGAIVSPLITRTLNKSISSNSCSESGASGSLYANYNSGGNGDTIPYIICNPNHFKNIEVNPSANFELANDIDFAGSTINPLNGNFTGVLDGKGFTVKNFVINRPSASNVGIFKTMSGATVKNIDFLNFSVNGYTKVGSIVGNANGVNTFDNITLEGSVTGILNTGGMIGVASSSATLSMSNISSTVNVQGNNYTGGLIGIVTSSDGSFSLDNIDLNNTVNGLGYVGGLVAQIQEPNTTITNVNSDSSVFAFNNYVGGLAGEIAGGSISFVTITGDISSPKDASDGHVAGLIGRSVGSVNLDNCSFTGSISAGSSHVGGILGSGSSASITNSTSSGTITVADDRYNSVTSYIGGIVGLLSDDSTIHDSNSSMNINAQSNFVGGIAGRFHGENSIMYNVFSTGTIDARTSFVGGVAGYFFGEEFRDSYSTSTVNITNPTPRSYIGGLLGYANSWTSRFERLYATGDVIINNGTADYVGGLIGYFRGGYLENSYASGNVSGVRNSSGALVGLHRGDTRGCFATGNITASGRNISALIGYQLEGSITDSFSTGNVEADGSAGGIVGYLNSTIVDSVTDVYAHGIVTQNTGSSFDSLTMGAILGEEFLAGSLSVTQSFYIQENRDASFNSLGSAVAQASASSAGSYTSFDFVSSPGWRVPNEGYNLEGHGAFTAPILSWMGGSIPNSRKISGPITNLNHSGITLNLNGVENLYIPAGASSYQFATELFDTDSYSITIATPTQNPTINCSLANASGVISGSDITNVSLTCPTFTSISLSASQTVLEVSGSSQLSAILNLSDLSTIDITNFANYAVSPSGVVTVDSTGQVVATSAGTTSVSASLNGLTSNGVSFTSTITGGVSNLSSAAVWIRGTPINSPVISWTNPAESFDSIEVGLGSSAGTDSIASFTNVGTNQSHSFSNLTGIVECSIIYPSARVKSLGGTYGSVVTDTLGFRYDNTSPVFSSNISVSGEASQSVATTTSWSSATDNCAMRFYELAIGTSPGASDITSGFKYIGNVTSYQAQNGLNGMNINLSTGVDYYTSVRAVDYAGNVSTVMTSAAWQITPVEDSLPNMLVWLDSADLLTVKDNLAISADSPSFNGNVYTWEDKSASVNVHNAIADATSDPDFISGNIKFNGSTTYLKIPEHADLNLSTDIEKNLTISVKTENDITTRQVIYEEGDANRGMNIYIDSGNLYCGFWNNSNDGDGVQPFVSVSSPISTDSTYHITWSLDYTNYNGAAGPDGSVECYINNSSVGSVATTSRLFSHAGDIGLGALLNSSHFHDGVIYSNQDYFFKGKILEFIIAASTPDATGVNAIHDYLRGKWSGSELSSPNNLALTNNSSQTSSATLSWSPIQSSYFILDHYEFAIGTTAGGDDILGWTNIGTVESYQAIDGVAGISLLLNEGVDYYISVKGVDTSNNDSQIATSNVWQVYDIASGGLPSTILHYDGQDLASILDPSGNDASDPLFSGTANTLLDISGSATVYDWSIQSGAGANYNVSTNALEFAGDTTYRLSTQAGINDTVTTSKNITISLKTGVNISTTQVVYEEGGSTRGMNIYIDQGKLYCAFWNTVDDGDGAQPFIHINTPINADSVYHVSWLYDYTNYTGPDGANGSLECVVNSNSIGTASTTTRVFPSNGKTGAIGLGGRSGKTNLLSGTTGGGSGDYFNGEINEVIITTETPDVSMIQSVHTYLNSKW